MEYTGWEGKSRCGEADDFETVVTGFFFPTEYDALRCRHDGGRVYQITPEKNGKPVEATVSEAMKLALDEFFDAGRYPWIPDER